ncbi:MAG TPA: 7-cyano-7-deazaguanine synthase [Candidatus Acidoferrales bacterium]|nr:7-cyano-7-deazaguanine synthase [Candidatus Acidoferrales bacterium]
MEKIAVLASGGLDSSVLIADMAANAEVFPIYVQWGLAWEATELAALKAFMAALDNPRVKPVTMLATPIGPIYGDHWSVTGKSVPGATEPDEAVFLPGRNILLIGLAAVWCATHGVRRVAVGSLGGNPFPDATPEFFQSYAAVLSAGLGREVQLEAPYRGLHKCDLVKRFANMPLELTLTCMAPAGGEHCGRCNKCAERQDAFRRAGVSDLTTYRG